MTDLPETNDPIVFMAEATVLLGASFLAGFGLAELLKRKDCREVER
ncbi:hypothetical protein R5W24_000533 [Gemmata sp. JC717]|nr:hypothetical protein [Gemmata algarum]MDY3551457.1 hypothetical protein [Gemmata algarum]